MTAEIDKVIYKMDAIMNGGQPGVVPPLDEAAMARLRGTLQPFLVDCRLCYHQATYGGYDDYCTLGNCINGNLFSPAPYRPLWTARNLPESEN